jgi:hypothetical protein
MSSKDTIEFLKFAARAATAQEDHWLKYRELVRRALPEGLSQQQELMLQAAFSKAWEAADNEGFRRGVDFALRTYGRKPKLPRGPG